MYCPKCGKPLDDEAIMCPNCGLRRFVPRTEKKKAAKAKKPGLWKLIVGIIYLLLGFSYFGQHTVAMVISMLIGGGFVLWWITGKPEKKPDTPPAPEIQKPAIEQSVQEPSAIKARVRGKAVSSEVVLTREGIDAIRRKFIAFDVETTGLSPLEDRIIEVGAVLFVNGEPVNSFSSLVNAGVHVPSRVTEINHITNNMLKDAPKEAAIYPDLMDFLGEALNGETIICAHNAKFDMGFLCQTLSRLGYDADIKYVDTLRLSRQYVRGVYNYKQRTLEEHFGLWNGSSHRAKDDAEKCGKILCRLLGRASDDLEEMQFRIEESSPTMEELAVCAFIQNTISEQGGDTSFLRYRRMSGGYVDISCCYTILRFKFSKKGKYIILRKRYKVPEGLRTEPCIRSEGDTENVRVFFDRPSDLAPLASAFYTMFLRKYTSMQELLMSDSRASVEIDLQTSRALSKEEVNDLMTKC